MSSGAFKKTFYQTANGDIVRVRIQPETETLEINSVTNTAPAGPATSGFPSAKVSGGRTEIGINCRLIRIKFVTAPTGYQQNGIITLPVLTDTAFAAYQNQVSGTYDVGGGPLAVTVVGFTPEDIV